MVTKTYEITITADSINNDQFKVYLQETLRYLSRFIFTDIPRYSVEVRETDVDDGR